MTSGSAIREFDDRLASLEDDMKASATVFIASKEVFDKQAKLSTLVTEHFFWIAGLDKSDEGDAALLRYCGNVLEGYLNRFRENGSSKFAQGVVGLNRDLYRAILRFEVCGNKDYFIQRDLGAAVSSLKDYEEIFINAIVRRYPTMSSLSNNKAVDLSVLYEIYRKDVNDGRVNKESCKKHVDWLIDLGVTEHFTDSETALNKYAKLAYNNDYSALTIAQKNYVDLVIKTSTRHFDDFTKEQKATAKELAGIWIKISALPDDSPNKSEKLVVMQQLVKYVIARQERQQARGLEYDYYGLGLGGWIGNKSEANSAKVKISAATNALKVLAGDLEYGDLAGLEKKALDQGDLAKNIIHPHHTLLKGFVSREDLDFSSIDDDISFVREADKMMSILEAEKSKLEADIAEAKDYPCIGFFKRSVGVDPVRQVSIKENQIKLLKNMKFTLEKPESIHDFLNKFVNRSPGIMDDKHLVSLYYDFFESTEHSKDFQNAMRQALFSNPHIGTGAALLACPEVLSCVA